MKNQYFGDINDYRKYGLLRALLSAGELNLLVAWMLTPDDDGRGGKLRDYLKQPEQWRHFDPELYHGLASLLRSASSPQVSLIEGTSLLPRATFYAAEVPDARSERDEWQRNIMELVSKSKADLVFFDPDNGIEVPSGPVGRNNSSKYVTWQEIQETWNAGCSLLIYQHFRSEPREAFAEGIVSELQRQMEAPFSQAFRTAHVLFLLAAQAKREAWLRQAIACFLPCWEGQINIMGFANKPM